MMNFYDKIKQRILYSHVRAEEADLPLIDYLCRNFSRFNREGWEEQINAGNIRVNDQILPLTTRLKQHDRVSYFPGECDEPEAELHYRTLYADKDILVVEKPPHLCVHPTGVFFRHTLWNLVGQDYGEVHFINRLDRETSGLLAAARNPAAAAAMERRDFVMRKEYLALVFGDFPPYLDARGLLLPDSASTVARKRKFVPDAPEHSSENTGAGEFARTELFAEEHIAPDMTLVRAILHTGRHQQVRATLFSLGFPLVGDKLYGPDETLFFKTGTQSFTASDYALLRMDRQALHATKLSFFHPFTGEEICCESPFNFTLTDAGGNRTESFRFPCGTPGKNFPDR